MNETPAPIDSGMIEQPVHRPSAKGGNAFVNFTGLLGGVDMDRPRRQGLAHDPQCFRRDRPQ